MFLKELELKKNNSEEYDIIIQKYFDVVITGYDSIYCIESCVNDKPIKKSLKEFFVQELVVFALAFNRDLNKNEPTSLNLYHAFKTCLFYLHQNMIILMFVSCMLHEKRVSNNLNNNKDNSASEDEKLKNPDDKQDINHNFNVHFNECKRKIEENKIWLNKNNYKKHLRSHYKNINSIIKNILKIIKSNGGNLKNIPSTNNMNLNDDNKAYMGDIKNVTIIVNYLKNIDIYKTEVIRDKIYKNLILHQIKNPLSIEDYIKSSKQSTDENKYVDEMVETEDKLQVSDNQNDSEILQNQNIILPPAVPFLPDIHPKYEYTLVLDLDETLVHYVEDDESAYIQIRPGAENFLEEMSEYFEIVIFTAAMQDVIYLN
jgi:hypothetical protein